MTSWNIKCTHARISKGSLYVWILSEEDRAAGNDGIQPSGTSLCGTLNILPFLLITLLCSFCNILFFGIPEGHRQECLNSYYNFKLRNTKTNCNWIILCLLMSKWNGRCGSNDRGTLSESKKRKNKKLSKCVVFSYVRLSVFFCSIL